MSSLSLPRWASKRESWSHLHNLQLHNRLLRRGIPSLSPLFRPSTNSKSERGVPFSCFLAGSCCGRDRSAFPPTTPQPGKAPLRSIRVEELPLLRLPLSFPAFGLKAPDCAEPASSLAAIRGERLPAPSSALSARVRASCRSDAFFAPRIAGVRARRGAVTRPADLFPSGSPPRFCQITRARFCLCSRLS